MRYVSDKGGGDDFGSVLADVSRARESEEEEFARRSPAAAAAFPFRESAAPAPQSLGDDFETFLDDAAPSTERETPIADDPESIAKELGIDGADGEEYLHRARRRFMWLNHPDRCDPARRALADRRVAIANMLIDRALATWASTKKRA
jgi:hypothetical protein